MVYGVTTWLDRAMESPRDLTHIGRGGVRRVTRAAIFAVAPLGLLLPVATACAPAPTFAVNSTVDADDATPGDAVCETATGNGICTLRAAISEANAAGTHVEITVPPGTYPVKEAQSTPEDDVNAVGDLDITGDVRIVGTGMPVVDAYASAGVRLVDVWGTASIEGMKFTGGNAYDDVGGDFRTFGSLTLVGSVVAQGSALYAGGGVAVLAGTATILRSFVGNNNAGAGAGVSVSGGAQLLVADSTFRNNNADYGAISNEGFAVLIHVTFVDNVGGNAALIYTPPSGVTTVAASVLDRFSGTDCVTSGSLLSAGYNLMQDDNNCLSSAAATDVSVPVISFGAGTGSPVSLPLLTAAGFDVIPAGTANLCDTAGLFPTDQRGTARPVGAGCEIGSVENP